ncbi:MAG: acylneuraminate cytidylyltransferase family protein [bacterium]|nr:acylneuraminate cytidylyltransferase family protein [bacterium]
MIAIIPARGGSKGLPGKNIKLLNGKPLIAYTIEAALKAKHVHRVILSTDDIDIADTAKKYGAEVPFMRPETLATDNALAIDVYKYTLNRLSETEGSIISEFIVLQPTSPLRTVTDIDNAITLFKEKDADSVISFCQEHHPIKWHKYVTPEGKLESIFENTIGNRQSEKPTYFPNGAIYVFKCNILDTKSYFTDKSYAYIMDRRHSVDIDTLEDFEYAEFLIESVKNKN